MTTVSQPGLDRATVVSAVITALAQVLKREPDSIAEQTRLLDDLGLDSTNVLELLMNLEDQLGLEFDSDTLEQRHFESVDTLAGYIIEQGA